MIARRKRPQRMLHAIAQLREHAIRNIQRILRDEIHAHALGAHEAHHQLDALQERLGRIGEKQMRFVKEKDEFGFVHIADFGQRFK